MATPVFSDKVARWRSIASKNPRKFVERRFRIADKMGNIVPFHYQWVQRQYSDIKQYILKTNQPLRLWVTKWRRCGMSAAETAESLTQCYGRDNARIGIIAQQEDRSAELLQNYRGYLDSLETYFPWMKIERSKDNIKGIRFEKTNSQVIIGTAENPGKIRGDGLHIVQASEAAHYYELFTKVMQELGPVVPSDAGSQIILESTGTLMGSDPYEHYMNALPWDEYLRGVKRGKNAYIRKYFCWRDAPECVKPFSPDTFSCLQELQEYIKAVEPRLFDKNVNYKLTPEQWHWSWEAYFLHGENDFDYFSREFPYQEADCWTSAKASFFGNYELSTSYGEDPQFIYVIRPNQKSTLFELADLEKVSQIDDYASQPNIKIWRMPRAKEKYILGADSAAGDGGGDYSSGYIINRTTRETMASYHGMLRPDEAAHINVSLCRLYNGALAAPETNWGGGGAAVINTMYKLAYHNIYVYRIRDGIKGIELSQKLGWWTKQSNREMILGETNKLFKDCYYGRLDLPGIFRDKSLILEMKTFARNPRSGRPEAMYKCKDDRVLAFSIANQVAADETFQTQDDLIHRYHRIIKANQVIDPKNQAQMMTKVVNPDQLLDMMMGANGAMAKNKFEIRH